MRVWIDQDLCTGDGLCEEIAPDVFVWLDDGLAYVREGETILAEVKGNPQGLEGWRSFPPVRKTSPSSPQRNARRMHLHRSVSRNGPSGNLRYGGFGR